MTIFSYCVQVIKMDASIKFIKILLIFTEFDIFNESYVLWRTIRRYIAYCYKNIKEIFLMLESVIKI